MPERRLQKTRDAYDPIDFLYYRFPWMRDYDAAIGEGIYAAVDIHGRESDVEPWIMDYYIAQAHRDRVDRQDRELRMVIGR